MCAIIDKDVLFQAFGKKTTPAGTRFREWLEGPRGMLVVGGDNLKELRENYNFSKWLVEARRNRNLIRLVKQTDIDSSVQSLNQKLKSNDKHVLALALASGARLLFSNDKKLQQDFGNTAILPHQAGQIYTTLVPDNGKFKHDGSLRDEHEKILANARCS